MDSILKDLRKYGFTLASGLLTAGALLGAGTGRPQAGVAAIIAVMALLTTLFSGDTYYSASMSGAVERALDLEARSWPPFRLNRSIQTKRIATGQGSSGSRSAFMSGIGSSRRVATDVEPGQRFDPCPPASIPSSPPPGGAHRRWRRVVAVRLQRTDQAPVPLRLARRAAVGGLQARRTPRPFLILAD